MVSDAGEPHPPPKGFFISGRVFVVAIIIARQFGKVFCFWHKNSVTRVVVVIV